MPLVNPGLKTFLSTHEGLSSLFFWLLFLFDLHFQKFNLINFVVSITVNLCLLVVGRLVAGLVREFLEYFDLDFSIAVFDPETNFVSLFCIQNI